MKTISFQSIAAVPSGGMHLKLAGDLTGVWTLQRSSDALLWESMADVTNTAGVVAIKLTCPTSPGENTIVRASAPVSAGRETCTDFRLLGTCPAAAQGSSDITSLYTARFGAPSAAKKVFVQVGQMVNGWEQVPVSFWAIVPA